LSGPVYDKYPKEVQAAVNNLLRFPIQTSLSQPGGPWWESVPDEIKSYITDKEYDYIPEDLYDFVNSDVGKDFCLSLLDNIKNRLEDILSFDIPDVEDIVSGLVKDFLEALLDHLTDYAVETLLKQGITAYLSLGDNIAATINPLGPGLMAASLVTGIVNIVQNQLFLDTLKVIQEQLAEINIRLQAIELKLDIMLNIQIKDHIHELYQNAQEMRRVLYAKEKDIAIILALKPEEIDQYVYDFLPDPSEGYQKRYDAAYTAVIETQKFINDPDPANNFPPLVKTISLRGTCAVAFLAFSLTGGGVEAPTSKTQIPPQPLLRPEKL
jgi:hypothetical protein